jgi:16S rRNA (cytosine1402-N4)-methyltransferase
MAEALHNPVMLNEVLAAFDAAPDDVIIDGTFGAGGYTRALLQTQCHVVAIDRDPNVELLAEALARDFPGRFLFLQGCFADMQALLADQNITQVNGVVLDLGVSSMQIDNADRGFSFSKNAPLDMRMGAQALSAYHVVNEYDEAALTRILNEYGEERFARKIARGIIAQRAVAPIETTRELALLIENIVPKKAAKKIHPATRSFQAIRIEVNDELGQLRQALAAAEAVLAPGGKLVVVSFHSLEDRIVKRFFQEKSGKNIAFSRHAPDAIASKNDTRHYSFSWPRPQKYYPTKQEIENNPRARSAVMRMAIRAHEPARESL